MWHSLLFFVYLTFLTVTLRDELVFPCRSSSRNLAVEGSVWNDCRSRPFLFFTHNRMLNANANGLWQVHAIATCGSFLFSGLAAAIFLGQSWRTFKHNIVQRHCSSKQNPQLPKAHVQATNKNACELRLGYVIQHWRSVGFDR